MIRFRKYYVLWFVLAGVLFLSGCGVPSIHSLYDSGNLVFEEQFTGRWISEDSTITYQVYGTDELQEQDTLARKIFETHRGNTRLSENLQFLEKKNLSDLYIIIEEGNNDHYYLGGLMQLNGIRYLDLYQISFTEDPEIFRFPVHIFGKVKSREDMVSLFPLSQKWLQEMIDKGETSIRHEWTLFNRLILTASTHELQRFMIRFGDRREAYQDSLVYLRAGRR